MVELGGHIVGHDERRFGPLPDPERIMQPTIKIIIFIIAISFVSSTCLSAAPGCPDATVAAFTNFAQEIETGNRPEPRNLPLFVNCDIKGKLRNDLAPSFAGIIARSLREKKAQDLRYMADVLETVTRAYEAGGNGGDYFKLSELVFAELGKENVDNLPQPPQGKSNYQELNGLIGWLREEAAAVPEPDQGGQEQDGQEQDGQEQDGQEQDGQEQDGQEQDGQEQDGQEQDGQEQDGQEQDGQGQDGQDKEWWGRLLEDWLLEFLLVGLIAALAAVIFLLGRRPKSPVYSGLPTPEPPPVPGPSTPPVQPSPVSPQDVEAELRMLRKNVEQLEQMIKQQSPVLKIVEEIASSLETIKEELDDLASKTMLQGVINRLEPLEDQLNSLEAKQTERIDLARQEIIRLEGRIQPPLRALLETEQDLLQEDWNRFLRTQKEIGELVETFAIDEDHKILFEKRGLLGELPGAVESDPQLSQVCASKLAPLHMYNQQLLQLSQVKNLTDRKLPDSPADQKKTLLRLRDSSHLLSTLRNTALGSRILRFRPSKWCAEELPELADLFLRFYQNSQAEGRVEELGKAKLENARELILKALRIGKLEPIEIVIGKTRFKSEEHVGRSSATDSRYPNGTIVGVVKNGFRNLRGDRKIVVQPEVIVNRI